MIFPFFFFTTAVAQKSAMAITNVKIVDVEEGKIIEGKTVIIQGNKIAAIDSGGPLPINLKIIDAEGKYLIPGLWDMHMHALPVKEIRDLYLAHGVTGVRDNGGSIEIIKLMDSLEQRGEMVPRSSIGVVINSSKLYPSTVTATTPVEAKQKIDSLYRLNVDFIKPYSGLSPEVFEALVKKCEELGIPAAGHIPDLVSTKKAAKLGQKSIEHSAYILKDCTPIAGTKDIKEAYQKMNELSDQSEARQILIDIMEKELSTFNDSIARSIAVALAKYNTAVTPTLITMYKHWYRPAKKFHDDSLLKYVPSRVVETWHADKQPYTVKQWKIGQSMHQYNQKLVDILNQEGVLLLAGTDMGVAYIYPGYSIHEELEMLVDAGLTPLEALQTATLNPAIYFRREKELGTISVNKFADLVLLNANPLEDISNTKNIESVWINGKYLNKRELKQIKENAVLNIKDM